MNNIYCDTLFNADDAEALINEFLNSNLRTDNVVFMDGTLYLTAVGKGDLECVFESDPEYLLRSGDLLATQKPALA